MKRKIQKIMKVLKNNSVLFLQKSLEKGEIITEKSSEKGEIIIKKSLEKGEIS